MKSGLFVCFLAILVLFTNGQITDSLKLNEIQILGTHNSYHVRPPAEVREFYTLFETYLGTNSAPAFDYSHIPIKDQLESQNVKCLELDIGYDPSGTLYTDRQVFSVLLKNTTDPNPKWQQPGYKTFHVQDVDFETTCVLFKDCLQEVKDYLDANTDSVPIFILLELRTPEDNTIADPLKLGFAIPITPDIPALEQEIREVFTDISQILTPGDVIKTASNLKEQLTTGVGWPTIAETKGKVVFCLATSARVNYIIDKSTSLLFPNSAESSDDAGIMVIDDPTNGVREMIQKGYIVRTRADVETQEARTGNTTQRDNAVASGAQIVSTDYPSPLQARNFIPPEITSGYSVDLPPTCNPVLVGGCEVTPQTDAMETSSRPLTGEGVFGFSGEFLTNIALDDRTRKLIDDYANLLGIPETALPASANYTPSPYHPSSNVNAMHSFPRPGAPTNFEYDNVDYWKGMIGIAIAFIVIAFLFVLISYFCFFECCCKCRRSRINRQNTNGKLLVLTAGSLLILALIGGLLTIIGDVNFAEGVNDSISHLEELQGIFTQVSRLGNTFSSLSDQLTQSISEASSLCPEFLSGQSSQVNSIVADVKVFADEASSATRTLPNDVQTIIDTLKTFNSAQMGVVVSISVWGLVLVLIFGTFLIFSTVINNRAPDKQWKLKATKYCLLPTAVFMVFGAVIIMALIIVASVALSDFCQEPDNNINKILNGQSQEFVNDFIVCNTTSDYIQFFNGGEGDFLLRLVDLQPMYNLTTLICPNDTAKAAYSQVLNNDLVPIVDTVAVEIRNTLDVLNCGAITFLYDDAVHRIICNTATDGMVLVWVGLLLVAICMGALLWSFGSMLLLTADGAKGLDDWDVVNSRSTIASSKSSYL